MSIIEALLLGLLQGLTEFIPVSSSGHLIIAHEFFGTTTSTLTFDVALHIGTLAALVLFFRRDISGLAKKVRSETFEGRLARVIIMATVPAAVVGLLAEEWIDTTLRRPETVVVTMLVMGMAMLVVDRYGANKRHLETIDTASALKIGLAQTLALIPGVSRSGATITAGMALGFRREAAARFSFLLAVPITAGAIVGSLLGDGLSELTHQLPVFFVGIITSFISGLFAIRFLLNYLSKHSLRLFAYYRIGFALIVLLLMV